LKEFGQDQQDKQVFRDLGKPLHVVCGDLGEEELLIVTAYEPDPEEWERDWKTRRRGS
jgi:hypothetical protein